MAAVMHWWAVVYAVVAFVAAGVAVVAQYLDRHDVVGVALVVLALTWIFGLICLILSKRAG